ncbi:MAG: hypothetical protein U1F87_12430 [Kiritimatiellia bacterium]
MTRFAAEHGGTGTAGGATANSLFKINILPPIPARGPPLGRTTLIGPIPGTGDYGDRLPRDPGCR